MGGKGGGTFVNSSTVPNLGQDHSCETGNKQLYYTQNDVNIISSSLTTDSNCNLSHSEYLPKLTFCLAVRLNGFAKLLCILPGVPDLERGARGDVLGGVEVDVDAQLVRHAVLLLCCRGNLHQGHPVAMVLAG